MTTKRPSLKQSPPPPPTPTTTTTTTAATTCVHVRKIVFEGRATKAKLAKYAEGNGLRPWVEDEGCDWDRPCVFVPTGYGSHTHAFNEAIFVKSGTIKVTGDGGAEIVGRKGDLITIPKNLEHAERSETRQAHGVLFEC